jgi:hypothetical protein
MAKVKRVNLRWFLIIHLAKTKIVDPNYFSVIDRSRRGFEEVSSVGD